MSAGLETSTVTPGTAAPPGSVTKPVIVCAAAGRMHARTPYRRSLHFALLISMSDSLAHGGRVECGSGLDHAPDLHRVSDVFERIAVQQHHIAKLSGSERAEFRGGSFDF